MGELPLLKKVMTASELLSHGVRLRSEVSFHAFALNCCVSEALSEVVLRAVASAVTTVANHWNNDLAVLFVVGEDAFEAVAQVVKVSLFGDLRLQDAGLHGRGRHAATVGVVNAHASTFRRLEEVVARAGGR